MGFGSVPNPFLDSGLRGNDGGRHPPSPLTRNAKGEIPRYARNDMGGFGMTCDLGLSLIRS